jgi:hypothetical protein
MRLTEINADAYTTGNGKKKHNFSVSTLSLLEKLFV